MLAQAMVAGGRALRMTYDVALCHRDDIKSFNTKVDDELAPGHISSG